MYEFGESSSPSIQIGNSNSNDAYKLQWVEINDGDEQIFVCDRNILCNVSLEFLKRQGFAGKKDQVLLLKLTIKAMIIYA